MPSSKKEVINELLRTARLQRGWSQQTLADKLGTTVISVKRWEHGTARPSPYFRLRLLTLFEMSAQELGIQEGEDQYQKQQESADTRALVPAVSLEENQEHSLIAQQDQQSNSQQEEAENETWPSDPQGKTSPRKPHKWPSRRTVLLGLGGTALVMGSSIGMWEYALSKQSPGINPSIILQYRYQTSSNTMVNTVSWSPYGDRLVCANGDKTVEVLNASQGAFGAIYQGHKGYVNYASWSPDEQFIASASSDKTVQIWNAFTVDCLLSYAGHSNIVLCVIWSPNGNFLASADKMGHIHIWQAKTGRPVLHYYGHDAEVTGLSWSPDGQWIASCGYDGTVQVWSAITGKKRENFTYQGPRIGTVYEVTWSPDGRFIVAAGINALATVWDATTGALIQSYAGHIGTVYTARWSPNGKWIASGGDDRTVQIWRALTGEHLLTYHGHTNLVDEIAWSPDGKRIASSSYDWTVHVCQIVGMMG